MKPENAKKTLKTQRKNKNNEEPKKTNEKNNKTIGNQRKHKKT